MLFVVKRVTAVSFVALSMAATPVTAADWPEVKISAQSRVPSCATPGRLMALAKSRNSALDARYETIAADYMKHGDAMGLRWDYAFFHMLVETNDLTFKKGIRGGAVKPEQNNFGGIGTMGGNEPGEAFKSVSDGVRAHLEHVTVYTGVAVDAALSDRTRKFANWDKFKEIQAGLKGKPARYSDVLGHWAPKSKAYLDGVEALATAFSADFCKKPDPRSDLIAAVGSGSNGADKPALQASAKIETLPEKPSGADLARKAVDDGKAEGNNIRTSLGAGLGASLAQPKIKPPAEVKILNEPPKADVAQQLEPDKIPAGKIVSASASAAAKAMPQVGLGATKAAPGPKCRVWTATYGRDKALIVKATVDGVTNYTVLDVNAGQEQREAEAYIAAYAKGGTIEAQFATQTDALEKAFDLCPEG